MANNLKISTGFRNALLGKEAQVIACKVGANMALVDGGEGVADTITNSDSDFLTLGFVPNLPLYLLGATTAANDAAITGVKPTAVVAGTITLPTATVNTAETFAATAVLAQAQGGSVYDCLIHGIIEVYSGTQPTSANNAPNGTKLITFTLSGGAFTAGSHANGLVMDEESSGTMGILSGDSWEGVAVVTGTATWFRFKGNATDADGVSTTLIRMDGSVATSSADLVLSTTSIVSGRTYRLNSFDFTMPAS